MSGVRGPAAAAEKSTLDPPEQWRHLDSRFRGNDSTERGSLIDQSQTTPPPPTGNVLILAAEEVRLVEPVRGSEHAARTGTTPFAPKSVDRNHRPLACMV
jgi:hypothetical protein